MKEYITKVQKMAGEPASIRPFKSGAPYLLDSGLRWNDGYHVFSTFNKPYDAGFLADELLGSR